MIRRVTYEMPSCIQRRARWSVISLVLACLGLTHLGCAPGVGTVQGKVTLDDRPIPVGSVTFFGPENRVVFCEIAEDGSYMAEGVPVGESKLTVETPNVRPFVLKPGEPPPPPGLLTPAYRLPNIPIPARYRDRKTSGLQLEVKPGEQLFNILLRSDASAGQ